MQFGLDKFFGISQQALKIHSRRSEVLAGNLAEYSFHQKVDETGVFDIGFRVFPTHEHLPHRMDFPLVKWI